jgi:hypothetical protein
MSAIPQENQTQNEAQKPSDKELNFRKQEEMFKRQLEQERQARIQAEEKLSKFAQERLKNDNDDDIEDSDEPYVDHKRLKRELGKVVKQTANETDTRIQNAVQQALSEERQSQWLNQNPDFEEIMSYADKFAEKAPQLAKSILNMPNTFERHKLVYENIKTLGLHKKEEPKTNIQEKIDANRKSPYYQPSGIGASPYAAAGDYSPTGQKTAFAKMQELKNRLRI